MRPAGPAPRQQSGRSAEEEGAGDAAQAAVRGGHRGTVAQERRPWRSLGRARRNLDVTPADLVASYERTPNRDKVPVLCEEQLVVECYSR